MKNPRAVLVSIALLALCASPGLCQGPHFTPDAKVDSPTSMQNFNGTAGGTVSVSVSTEHWFDIAGASANTQYSCSADFAFGVSSASPSGGSNNNQLHLTTDALGAGTYSPHITESVTPSVSCPSGVTSHTAYATTRVYNVPMGFTVTIPNPYNDNVTFTTTGH